MKTCTKCGEVKALDKFWKRKNSKDGYRNECGACRSKNGRKWVEANKEKVTEAKRKYRKANKDKLAESSKRYREANKDKVAEIRRKWRQKNKEQIIEYKQNYYSVNKDKVTESTKRYRESNKEKYRLSSSRYGARKRALPDTLTLALWNQILSNNFNGICALTSCTDEIHIEHFIPLSWGHGGTTPQNCYPLCKELNSSKQDTNPFEWINRYPEYQTQFNRLVEYLAEQNQMSVQEFKSYVYWCESNKIDIEVSGQLELQL